MTIRAVAGTGSSSTMKALLRTDPAVPSLRANDASAEPGPGTTPAAPRMPLTAVSSSGWFLAENASMQGGMTTTRSGSRTSHPYCRRENTW